MSSSALKKAFLIVAIATMAAGGMQAQNKPAIPKDAVLAETIFKSGNRENDGESARFQPQEKLGIIRIRGECGGDSAEFKELSEHYLAMVDSISRELKAMKIKPSEEGRLLEAVVSLLKKHGLDEGLVDDGSMKQMLVGRLGNCASYSTSIKDILDDAGYPGSHLIITHMHVMVKYGESAYDTRLNKVLSYDDACNKYVIFNKGQETAANDAVISVWLSKLYLSLKMRKTDLEGAIAELGKAEKEVPFAGCKSDNFITIGDFYFVAGNKTAALKAYEAANRADPQNWIVYETVIWNFRGTATGDFWKETYKKNYSATHKNEVKN